VPNSGRPEFGMGRGSPPSSRHILWQYDLGRETMQRTKPPFRADHVGSLLRSVALKDARGKREQGEITAAATEGGRGSPRSRR